MTTRRGNGEGHPRKRPDGRWELQVSVDGQRRSLYGKTRQEVLRKRKELDLAPRSQTAETVAELAAVWLENVIRPHKAKLTTVAYDQYLRVHVLPIFGAKRVGDVRPADVERWVAELRRKALAPDTIRLAMAALRGLLTYAVRTERVARNAASLVPVGSYRPRKVPIPTPEQARGFIEALGEDAYGPIFLAILTLGLRRGEVLGLTWDSIDLDHGIIHITKQLKWIPHEGFELGDLKRESSRRDLHLSPQLTKLFATLKAKQVGDAFDYSKIGHNYDTWGLVFRTVEGRPIGMHYALRRLRAVLKRAGLDEGLRLHDLRHHYASILFAQGVDPKVVQEQLGHASLGITMNVYTHLLPKARKEANEQVWDYLGGE